MMADSAATPPLYGPHRITRNGQVVIPREILRAAGVEPGGAVYFLPGDDPDAGVLVVPARTAATWIERGRRGRR
jgi:bifunctional DNA-binding transcriptional regulator/antitoxin component of YhaV-PrlF toxin-antitoxin module